MLCSRAYNNSISQTNYLVIMLFPLYSVYKKHYPPMLNDEVWRLEKIGKDGAFHKKLASINVNSVQDFLKLSIVDPAKLKNACFLSLIMFRY